MSNARTALARQLERAERIAEQHAGDAEIAKTCETLRAEIRAVDAAEVSAWHAEAMAALARQLLNARELAERLREGSK